MSLIAVFPLFLATACLEVEGPRITAGLLAQAAPELAAIAGGTEFGYSPAPGATRWVRRGELSAFASSHGVALPAVPEVCVTRAARVLDAEEVRRALAQAVAEVAPGSQPGIEIVDFVRLPLPRGMLRFSRSKAQAAPDGTVLWHGRIEYDRSRSVPVWVRAKIQVDRAVAYALVPVAKGRILTGEDIEIRQVGVSLMDVLKGDAPPTLIGMEALRAIEAGQPIPAQSLGRPMAIRPGEAIRAFSEWGAVRITVEALALKGGRTGDAIQLETKSTRQKLRARITSPGEARIESEGPLNESVRPVARGGIRSAGRKGERGAEADAAGGAR